MPKQNPIKERRQLRQSTQSHRRYPLRTQNKQQYIELPLKSRSHKHSKVKKKQIHVTNDPIPSIISIKKDENKQETLQMKLKEISIREVHLKQQLNELERMLETHCKSLQDLAEQKIEDLRMELKVQLIGLPEAVKKMSVTDFANEFDGDIEKFIQTVKKNGHTTPFQSPTVLSVKTILSKNRRNISKSRVSFAASKAPITNENVNTLNQQLITSPSFINNQFKEPRDVKIGEPIFSKNGSPLQIRPRTIYSIEEIIQSVEKLETIDLSSQHKNKFSQAKHKLKQLLRQIEKLEMKNTR